MWTNSNTAANIKPWHGPAQMWGNWDFWVMLDQNPSLALILGDLVPFKYIMSLNLTVKCLGVGMEKCCVLNAWHLPSSSLTSIGACVCHTFSLNENFKNLHFYLKGTVSLWSHWGGRRTGKNMKKKKVNKIVKSSEGRGRLRTQGAWGKLRLWGPKDLSTQVLTSQQTPPPPTHIPKHTTLPLHACYHAWNRFLNLSNYRSWSE